MSDERDKDEPAGGDDTTPPRHVAPSQHADRATGGEQVDPRLLEILVCPLTKTRLVYDKERHELISRAAGLAYPIRSGVPMMTPDVARDLDKGEDSPANRT